MPRSTLSPQQILQEAYDESTGALRVSGLTGTYSGWQRSVSLKTGPLSVLNAATWAISFGGGNNYDGVLTYNSSHAQNDGGVWAVDLSAGTWKLTVAGGTNPAYAISTVDISFDNGGAYTAIGTLDHYAAAPGTTIADFTGIVVPTSGKALLRFRALTRHASASDWYLGLSAADFSRTA